MGHWDNDNVSVSGLICNKSKQAPSKIVQNQFNLTTKVKHLKGSFKGASMMIEGMVKIILDFSRVNIVHFKGVLRQF